MIDHLLELSHRDDSSKLSNIGFGEEITQVESIEVNFTHLICSHDLDIVFVGVKESNSPQKKIQQTTSNRQ